MYIYFARILNPYIEVSKDVGKPICEFEWLEGIKLKPEQSDHDLAIFKA